jgi:hypothetical protein
MRAWRALISHLSPLENFPHFFACPEVQEIVLALKLVFRSISTRILPI